MSRRRRRLLLETGEPTPPDEGNFLLINDSGDVLLINESGDKLLINEE